MYILKYYGTTEINGLFCILYPFSAIKEAQQKMHELYTNDICIYKNGDEDLQEFLDTEIGEYDGHIVYVDDEIVYSIQEFD